MNFNLRSFFSAACVWLLLSSFLIAQTPQPNKTVPQTPNLIPTSGSQTGFVTPADVNVLLGSDVRLFVVMAALNLAGYDYEPAGRNMSELRSRLRNELQPDPTLLNRLQSFYRSKRRLDTDEPSQAAPYVALAFVMSPPPNFELAVPVNALPPDVAAISDFAALAGELYRRTNMEAILPKYAPEFDRIAVSYYKPIGEMCFQVLSYLHTRPIT